MKVFGLIIALLGLAPLHSTASPPGYGTLKNLPAMSFNRAGHTATTLPDGTVLVVGGFMEEEQQIAGVELFDPRTLRFQTIDNLVTPRQSHTATLLADGRVLIAGGHGAQAPYLDTAEIFDPATRQFVSAGRMTAPRGDHTALVLDDGRIALIGGTGTDRTILDSIEIFDPKGRTFSMAGRMTVPRMGHVSVLLRDGRILIAGGNIGRRATLKIHSTAEIFDPRSARSSPAADMLQARHKHDGVLLADGRVLVIGGSTEHAVRSDSAEIYDPARNTFTPAATMKSARYKLRNASLLLSNGDVLIAGGAEHAELYDPRSGQFRLLQGSSPLHGYFSATASLRKGRVLITGGYARPNAPSRSAWIFEP